MKAYVKYKYGGPEVLRLEEVEKPRLTTSTVLVKIKANAANPADWRILRGKPIFARMTFGIFKPTEKILGADFAGIVTEIGEEVTTLRVGDRVFGELPGGGAFAEYAGVDPRVCARMPEGTTYTEMACVPLAGVTALQALLTHGNVKEGEKVLINGSTGGVGHFAVQIAKACGAHVTAVCSNRNIDFVKSIGADDVIPHDEVNIHQFDGVFDLVVDTHGNLDFADYKRLGKRGVMVGFTTIGHMISVLLHKGFSKFPLTQFTAEANSEDLNKLATLIQQKKIKPQIEKIYPHSETPTAIAHVEGMKTRGKVAITWEE